MNRVVATVNAQNKHEAIAALELLMDKIKNSNYDGEVQESCEVADEGMDA